MRTTKNLLVELFVEELPPKALKKLGEAFAKRLADELVSRRAVEPEDADRRTWFATPRRLAVHIPSVIGSTPDLREMKKLMPRRVAQSADGTWTPAFLKKLRSLGYAEGGVPDADLLFRDEGGTEHVFLNQVVKGRLLSAALQDALTATVVGLPIPKVMSYQLADGWSSVNFVRPAHGLVALHGTEVVPVTALGLTANRVTRGHRFEAAVDPVHLEDADHYTAQLEQQGAVIASFELRRGLVVRQLEQAAAALGLKPIEDEALLDEVTALVERPNVLLCEFEREFLAVPPECLILTMKANQKYFPLLDAGGALTNRFLVVSNIRPADASAIVQGNERVVRPRLADAKFFFDQDRKKTLASRLPMLDKVVYHGKLGSQGERVLRVRAIARAIGEQLGGAALAAQADRAAELAKCDLVTDMVGEFPELQGVMGGYYAHHDGESEAVAFAIEDHYKPRFAGDALPRNEVGMVAALADKLETLVGLFGVGEKPTGDRDPFALRRHALGVIRMLIERDLPCSLGNLVGIAKAVIEDRSIQEQWSHAVAERDIEKKLAAAQAGGVSGVVASAHGFVVRVLQAATEAEVLDFVYERLAGTLRDAQYTPQEVDAVLGLRPERLADVPKRLTAVRAFAALPESASLAAANKRIANILKKSEAAPSAHVDPARLVEAAERSLHDAILSTAPKADELFDEGEYTASLRELAALKAPVDAFFDHVMVNADDPVLRANRLALLARLHQSMNRVADLSKLAA